MSKGNFAQTSIGVVVLGVVTALLIYIVEEFLRFPTEDKSMSGQVSTENNPNSKQTSYGPNSPNINNTSGYVNFNSH